MSHNATAQVKELLRGETGESERIKEKEKPLWCSTLQKTIMLESRYALTHNSGSMKADIFAPHIKDTNVKYNLTEMSSITLGARRSAAHPSVLSDGLLDYIIQKTRLSQ